MEVPQAVQGYLDAFESYAVKLHDTLGDLELVARTLELLLSTIGVPIAVGATSSGSDASAVATWCLEGTTLAGNGPAAVARALLLEQAVRSPHEGEGVARVPELLLGADPAILADATEPVAARVAGAVAACLPEDDKAALYLTSILDSGGVCAYARAAEALLARHRAGSVAKEAWQVAVDAFSGPSAADRRVCLQRLLPPLVAATPRDQAAPRLSTLVEALLDRGMANDDKTGSGRAELADALGISVSFHELLLDHWRLSSAHGKHDSLGERVISAGLRMAHKEAAAIRRHAKFLLETVAAQACRKPETEKLLRGTGPQSTAWRSFWELYDALEEFATHVLKASWDHVVGRLMSSLADLRASWTMDYSPPPCLFNAHWLEVLFARALAHDNDNVQKFVLGQLMALDQGTARLSESFILGDVLPRLSEGVNNLYPRTDAHQVFERQVSAFFLSFVQSHPDGEGAAARRLLLALLEVRSGASCVHRTPLRVVLHALAEVTAPGGLEPREALGIVESFCEGVLMLQPISTRPGLVATLIRVATQLSAPSSDPETCGEAALLAAKALAAVPDALLDGLHAELGALLRGTVGEDAGGRSLELLQGLASSSSSTPAGLARAETLGRQTLPMDALALTLGAVRSVWALSATEASLCSVWERLLPTLQDMHRRPYLPLRTSAAVLFCAAYATSLFPCGPAVLERHPQERNEALAYASAKAAALLDPSASVASQAGEAAWLWLYALVLERFWRPGLAHGEAVIDAALIALQRGHAVASADPDAERAALSGVAAASFLGALAPACTARRAELFIALWRASIVTPASISDVRWGVAGLEGLGQWKRARNEEYEDLHRVEREGLGRVLEWRDTLFVFLSSKWRALAALACADGLGQALDAAKADVGTPSAREVALALLREFDQLTSPHVAYWSVLARRLIYPTLFAEGGLPQDELADALRVVCTGLSGWLAWRNLTGFMARGCLVEMSAALCDPLVCLAERRLGAGKHGSERPFTEAVARALSLGEATVGVSRSVVVPLLSALVRPTQAYKGDASAVEATAELLVTLLLHKEATIADGSLSHAPPAAAGCVDAAGPGGLVALERSCPAAEGLCAKFGGTSGLPRILVLAALDALSDAGTDELPALTAATLRGLLAALREIQEQVLKPPSGKTVANRPPTPRPLSLPHRLQLRGWQAVLILGCRADRATAERIIPEFFWHLGVPHNPDVRDYQELLGCALGVKYPDLAIEPHMVPLLKSFDSNAQVASSLLVITSYLFRSWAAAPDSSIRAPHVRALLLAAVPYLMHNNAYVRGTAAWGFFQVFEAPCAADVLDGLPDGDAAVLRELGRFLSVNVECGKMRRRLKPIFDEWDPTKHVAIDVLTEKSVVLPSPGGSAPQEVQGSEHTMSDDEFHPTQTFLASLKAEVAELMDDLYLKSDPTQFPSLSEEWRASVRRAAEALSTPAAGAEADEENLAAGGSAGSAAGLQRKPEVPSVPSRLPGDLALAPASRRVRAPLIVVASLIDKAPNLAGLCRTCEIFNCQELCMPSLQITNETAFKGMSVTAEKWLPLREVPRAALADHLRALRRKGYALVGVEQTHDSVQLDQWKFAKQTVILLGAEKEGIDAELLPLLDGCVEIPQSGLIRSLNVHVSGSLAIWEYTRQHLTRTQEP